jgi:hypothetical protein
VADPNAIVDVFHAPVRPPTVAERASLLRRVRVKLAELLIGPQPAPGAAPAPVLTTQTGASDATYASFGDRVWNVSYQRRAVYFDLLDMDRNDPMLHTALSIHADCTVCYEDVAVDGFDWTMTLKNERAQDALDDLKERLNLGAEVWQIVRKFVQFGEEYREVVVDDRNLVVAFNSLPAYQVMPKFDAMGNRLPGWSQRPEQLVGARPIHLDEWQVIPFMWGPRWGYFGTGLMAPARRSWRRLQKLADGMAIARMTRAYDKLVHKVPVEPKWNMAKQYEAIGLYRQNLTKRRSLDQDGNVTLRDDPMTPTTEIFIPDDGSGRGGVETLALQNMQLMNVEDLRFHQDEILTCCRVPRKYLNLVLKGAALGDSSIMAEDIQFARVLRQNQATLRLGLRQLARVALLLRGFDADELGVNVKLAKINVQDYLTQAKVQMNLAQAANVFAQTLLTGGIAPEIVYDRYMQLSDADKEIMRKFQEEQEKDELAALRKEKAEAAKQQPQNGKLPRTNANGGGGAQQGLPTAEEVSQVLAKLGMMCQELAEKEGLQFDLTYEDRLAQARDVIAETCLNGSR